MTVKIKLYIVCISNATERTSLIPMKLGGKTERKSERLCTQFVCIIISEGSKTVRGNGGGDGGGQGFRSLRRNYTR